MGQLHCALPHPSLLQPGPGAPLRPPASPAGARLTHIRQPPHPRALHGSHSHESCLLSSFDITVELAKGFRLLICSLFSSFKGQPPSHLCPVQYPYLLPRNHKIRSVHSRRPQGVNFPRLCVLEKEGPGRATLYPSVRTGSLRPGAKGTRGEVKGTPAVPSPLLQSLPSSLWHTPPGEGGLSSRKFLLTLDFGPSQPCRMAGFDLLSRLKKFIYYFLGFIYLFNF